MVLILNWFGCVGGSNQVGHGREALTELEYSNYGCIQAMIVAPKRYCESKQKVISTPRCESNQRWSEREYRDTQRGEWY